MVPDVSEGIGTIIVDESSPGRERERPRQRERKRERERGRRETPKQQNAPPYDGSFPVIIPFHHSKMFLPKPKPHIRARHPGTRLPDIPRRRVRSTKVDADIRPQLLFQPADIAPGQQPVPQRAEQLGEIGTAEVRARLQLRQGIEGGADAVEIDVGGLVNVQPLGEVSVDPKEFQTRAGPGGRGDGLRFEGG